MFKYCFKIASNPKRKFIVDIIRYTLLSIGIFMSFLFSGTISSTLPPIFKYNRINLLFFSEIFTLVYSIYLFFYIGKNKEKKKLLLSIEKLEIKAKNKYFMHIIISLIPAIIGEIISMILSTIGYVIAYLILNSKYGYGFNIPFYIYLLTLFIPLLHSFISASYSFLDYFNTRIIEKYDVLFFISALASIFLFIFIEKSIIVFVLFVIFVSLFLGSLIYNLLYFYSTSKSVNLSRRSSFIYLLVRRKNIVYYTFGILAMFINAVFIASNYSKFLSTTEFYKYDYVIETEDTSEYLPLLFTSSRFEYNIIESKNIVSIDEEKYNLLSLDITKFDSIYNLNSYEKLSYIPENAIIIPKTIYNDFDKNPGDKVIVDIDGEIEEFILYALIDDYSGTLCFTNKEIKSNTLKKYILIKENDRRSTYQELNTFFNGNLKRKYDTEPNCYTISTLKLISAVILFVFISSLVILLYIEERKAYDESIEYDKKKLEAINLKKREVSKTIVLSNYLMFLITFIFTFIILILVSYYNIDYINILFKVDFVYKDISRYFIYLLEIFIFFTIIIFVDYLIEKGKNDYEF